MKAIHRILSRHTKLADAQRALAVAARNFEDFNRDYAKEVGHLGERLVAEDKNDYVASFIDLLGSGEFFAIREDAESFVVIGSW